VRQFWLGVLVGIIIGPASATIYCELSSEPDEAVIAGPQEQTEHPASVRGMRLCSRTKPE
jgi:hypothetical protein